MAKILVADDQQIVRTPLVVMLREAGHDVDQAANGEQACALISAHGYDLVLTDLKMGRVDGFEVLRHTRERSPGTDVIVMTAYGTIETAVEAMRRGACDYLPKPFTEQELLRKIQDAMDRRGPAEPEPEVSTTIDLLERDQFKHIIGNSVAIRDVLSRIVRIAPTEATVLITGESGTGKELVARTVHASSRRADRPFVSINCAAITETLLESELFGHTRGAFTGAVQARKGLFEEANGGTFFFDEIAETPPSLQAKLLRAIQDGEIKRLGDNKSIRVNVRIIAATNQDLKALIEQKHFREDLYYRLNVARFKLPPLRERREDIPPLVHHFLRKHTKRLGRYLELGEGVMDYLMQYDYPGNVRELENLVEQGVALAVHGYLELEDIVTPEMEDDRSSMTRSLQDVVDRAERDAILRVLEEVDGNKERAAERLGLSATTLWRKMKRLELAWPKSA